MVSLHTDVQRKNEKFVEVHKNTFRCKKTVELIYFSIIINVGFWKIDYMMNEQIFELISLRQAVLKKLKKLDKEIVEKLNKHNINGNTLADERYPLGYEEEYYEEEPEENEETEFGLGGDWWKNN